MIFSSIGPVFDELDRGAEYDFSAFSHIDSRGQSSGKITYVLIECSGAPEITFIAYFNVFPIYGCDQSESARSGHGCGSWTRIHDLRLGELYRMYSNHSLAAAFPMACFFIK